MDSRSRIVRTAADAILAQAQADPGFVDRFLDDPAGTLDPLGIAPGLAEEAAAEYAKLAGLDEVSGYGSCGRSVVCKVSCCISKMAMVPPKR